jgi:hypothetical protein
MKIIDMLYPIEYYINEITKYEEVYYGFNNSSVEINQLLNISQIKKVDNIIPDFLTFLVSWYGGKGYIYYLYAFDENQKLMKHYYCGQFAPFVNHRVLMDKLTGEIMEYGDISIADFNNDGINEIAVYTDYKYIGMAFCVYGFNTLDNELEELCLVPVYINLDYPFPSVEYIKNGFRILEVIEDDPLELAWNNYIWEIENMKYIRQ